MDHAQATRLFLRVIDSGDGFGDYVHVGLSIDAAWSGNEEREAESSFRISSADDARRPGSRLGPEP